MFARLLLLILAIALGGAFSVPASAAEPFALETWKVPGRPLSAHAIASSDGTWLAVISVQGAPPAERRYVTLGRLDHHEPVQVELSPAVVAIDLGELDPGRGPEILTIESERLRVLGIDGAVRLTVPVSPPLPLPPRTRQVARLEVLGDWDGQGRLEALLPDLAGLRVLPLAAPEAAHGLRTGLAHVSEGGFGGGLSQSAFWVSRLAWPRIALADQDGDGRDELWASDRFGLSVFARGPEGLDEEPIVRRAFPPFTFEEERRFQANPLRAEAADLGMQF